MEQSRCVAGSSTIYHLPSSMSEASIDSLRTQFDSELAAATSEAELRAIRDRYLSRKGGLVSNLLKSLGSAPADERPRLGKVVNDLKTDIEARLTARLEANAASRPPK